MLLVDCNDELTDMLGSRMTNAEFIDKYNDILEERTRDSLEDQGIDNASTDEWDEEFDNQKDSLMEDRSIVLSD